MEKLIVIEGACDGIGKTTQYNLLKEYLIKKYSIEVLSHHFPSYNTPQGKCVEMYLDGKFGDVKSLSPYFINGLYAIDRAVTWHEEFKDVKDKIILLDRYTTSSLIYQSSVIKDENEKKAFIDYVIDFEYNKLGIGIPDDVIFLTAPYDLVSKMRKNRQDNAGIQNDIHEKDEELQKAFYQNALMVANYLKWTKIDCAKNEHEMKSIEEIHQEICNHIDKVLTKKR